MTYMLLNCALKLVEEIMLNFYFTVAVESKKGYCFVFMSASLSKRYNTRQRKTCYLYLQTNKIFFGMFSSRAVCVSAVYYTQYLISVTHLCKYIQVLNVVMGNEIIL